MLSLSGLIVFVSFSRMQSASVPPTLNLTVTHSFNQIPHKNIQTPLQSTELLFITSLFLRRNGHNPQDTGAKGPVWKSIVFIDSVLMKWRFQHLVCYLTGLTDIGHMLENTLISGCSEWMCWTLEGKRCFHTQVFQTSFTISMQTQHVARKIYRWIEKTARRWRIKEIKLLPLCHFGEMMKAIVSHSSHYCSSWIIWSF